MTRGYLLKLSISAKNARHVHVSPLTCNKCGAWPHNSAMCTSRRRLPRRLEVAKHKRRVEDAIIGMLLCAFVPTQSLLPPAPGCRAVVQAQSSACRRVQANANCTAVASDVSATALDCLQSIAEAAGVSDRVSTAAFDAADADAHLEAASADACLLIFTLAAVHPDHMPAVLAAAHRVLKPGGKLYVRDHGLYDMTSLRFPPEQRISDSLYFRCACGLVMHVLFAVMRPQLHL